MPSPVNPKRYFIVWFLSFLLLFIRVNKNYWYTYIELLSYIGTYIKIKIGVHIELDKNGSQCICIDKHICWYGMVSISLSTALSLDENNVELLYGC